MIESQMLKQRDRQEINFDIPQLLISKDKEDMFIVLSNGCYGDIGFEGTIIWISEENKHRFLGQFYKTWSKMYFELFEGEILLKQ